mgnify:CR=1 FL=1
MVSVYFFGLTICIGLELNQQEDIEQRENVSLIILKMALLVVEIGPIKELVE